MSNKTKKIMKVTCYLDDKVLCKLNWDEMPNTGMGFSYKKKQYVITDIEDSKITLKDITITGGVKQQ